MSKPRWKGESFVQVPAEPIANAQIIETKNLDDSLLHGHGVTTGADGSFDIQMDQECYITISADGFMDKTILVTKSGTMDIVLDKIGTKSQADTRTKVQNNLPLINRIHPVFGLVTSMLAAVGFIYIMYRIFRSS